VNINLVNVMDEIPIFVAILSFVIMCIGEILAYYSVSLKYKYEFEGSVQHGHLWINIHVGLGNHQPRLPLGSLGASHRSLPQSRT